MKALGDLIICYYLAKVLKIIPRKDFSRAIGLHHGISLIEENHIMFLCDVDMVFNAKTLHRIRFNTRHQQVYAPIFFSEYGPMFDRHGGIHEDNGYWRVYSYGMISILNHDYKASEYLCTLNSSDKPVKIP